MSRTLLDITGDLRALDDLLAEVEGDISDPKVLQAIDAWFAELDQDMLTKCDNYAAFITELQARAATRKSEADRLAKRAKIDSNNADFLKQRLLQVMQGRSMKKLETDRYRISVSANGGKQPLDVHDASLIPQELKRHIPERYEPDPDLIRVRLDAGVDVPGAVYQPRGSHLRIK